MRHITWGLAYWPRYLIVASIAFLIPEITALIGNPRNTLSDYCWIELHLPLQGKHPTIHDFAWYFSFSAWLAFVVIITLHIWFQKVR